MRGATWKQVNEKTSYGFQSTLPVRGATGLERSPVWDDIISIHAPRAGSDNDTLRQVLAVLHFNPRSPCGERLRLQLEEQAKEEFQSTLPVRGATRNEDGTPKLPKHFNPRSPCGERPPSLLGSPRSPYFNPRSPCGERPRCGAGMRTPPDFNPRSPCGERPARNGCLTQRNR